MEKAVPPRSTQGLDPLRSAIILILFLSAVAASPAGAAYVNPRITGDRPWEPSTVRPADVLGSLRPVPREGRLSGIEKKTREEAEVNLETGRLTIRHVYGKTVLGPEWIEDLRDATHAAGRRAAYEEWASLVRKRSLQPLSAADQSTVTIDIPVEFPGAVADVIGQGARLNLTGSERITFSGTSNIIKGGPQFESQSSSAFPDLDMKQELRVNLDGTIGRKIHVLLNHDSQAQTDLSNKIQLRYDGDEDEVVQKIEMGNTELALPGAEFLSFRKSQQGLFGAKALGKFGPLDIGMIASKQEGQTATQTFVGQARRDSVVIDDINYVKRKYYLLADPEILANDSLKPTPVRNFELFLDDKNPLNDLTDNVAECFAYIDAANPDTTTGAPGRYHGFFHRLEVNVDYQVIAETGEVVLETPVSPDHAVAMFYVTASGDSIGDLTGTNADGDPLYELQILAPPQRELYDDTKGFAPARDFEMKNVYFLLARNILPESLELVIRRRASVAGEEELDLQNDPANPANTAEYVRILGLDSRGINSPDPDLKVEAEFFDFEEGTLTFPNITPFAPDSSTVNVLVGPGVSTGRTSEPGPKLLQYNSVLYSQEPTEFTQGTNLYQIEARYTTPTPTYSLNRFNILEGSERVRLNGRALTRGTDYDIDYEIGVITFRTQEASLPDAQIEVDFEFVPLFGQSKESLAGMSGTYNFSPDTRLSSTWLYFSKASPELRPRLGQEPSHIMVGNLFGQGVKLLPSVTNLVNAIPLVTTEEASEVQVEGELAMSVPNPNTKNEIYIDDMEGVEDSRDLSITRALWVPASEPIGPVIGPDGAEEDLNKTNVLPFPFNWYNPDNVVRRKEVFPELTGQQEGEDFLQVLEFAVRPDSGASEPTRWMGIQRNLSVTGEDFSEKKFLEIWVNDFDTGQGRIIFDMGEISEDFYVKPDTTGPLDKGRNFLDTEDTDNTGDLTVSKEDHGLDNVDGTDGQNVPGDDGNDDFFFERTSVPDFTRINNYEDNSLLDTEDLDNDRLLDLDNVYFSYVLDLRDSIPDGTGMVANPFIVQDNGLESPGNGWRLFQIPLDLGLAVGGVPRRKTVKYARLWFEGLPLGPGRKIQIASLKILGASWLEEKFSTNDTGVPDESLTNSNVLFAIKDVNNKEDAVYAGQEPFDPGTDSSGLLRREQSLVIDYLNIPSSVTVRGRPPEGPDSSVVLDPPHPPGFGRQGSAYREILDTGEGQNQDFTQYESLSFYLRDGQPLMLAPGRPDTSQGTFFYRFGPDTTNFYEFSTKMESKWRDWREVFLNLNDLAELKLDPPEGTRTVEGIPVSYRHRIVDGDTLAVYGEPSLTRVRRMTVGVKGDDPLLHEVNGIIWFNEIRLRSVKKDVGYASRLSGGVRMADFATVSSRVRLVDSEFRRIDGERLGSDELAWDVTGDLKLNKFIDGYGLSLPISGQYSSTKSIPRLAPNSDIELEEEVDRQEAATETEARSVSARFVKTRPATSGWVRYTLDNISLSFTDNWDRSRSPFQVSKHTGTSVLGTYNLNPGQGKSIRLLKRFDFSYFPTFKMGVNGNLNVTNSSDIVQDSTGVRAEVPRVPVRTRNLDAVFNTSWDPLRSGTFDSQLTFNKVQDMDLRKDLPLAESIRQGSREEARDHSARLSWRPGYVRWLRPVVTYDTRYDEDSGESAQAPDIQERLRRVSNTSNREFSATLALRQLLPQKAGETKRATRRPSDAGRTPTQPPDEIDREQEPPPDEGQPPPRDEGRPPPPNGGQSPPPNGGQSPPPNGAQSPPPRQSPPPNEGQPPPPEEFPPSEEPRTPPPPEETQAPPAQTEPGAPADSAGAQREGPPKLPSFKQIGSKLLGLLNGIGDIRASYGDRRTSRYGRVGERPDLLYQLGFEDFDKSLIEQGTNVNQLEDRTDNSYVTKIDTTIQPSSYLFLDGQYVRTISRQSQSGTRTKSDEVTFPDVSLSLDGLEKRFFLKKMAKTSSFNSSFRKLTRYSGRLPAINEVAPPEKTWYDSKDVKEEFSPLFSWSTSWNSGLNTTLSYNTSTGEDETQFNDVLSTTKTTAHALRLNGRYSFSAPRGISFLGKRIRFRSDMTLNFDFDRSEDKVEEFRQTSASFTPPIVRSHRKNLSVKPRATYNFSKSFKEAWTSATPSRRICSASEPTPRSWSRSRP